MRNIKKLAELWNNYIDKFKISTSENFCNLDRDLVAVANIHALIIQDNNGNLIAIDLASLVKCESVPEYFVIENGELVGFDVTKLNSVGFYPNGKFYELYQDMMSAHSLE